MICYLKNETYQNKNSISKSFKWMVDSKTRLGVFFFFFSGVFLESTGGNMLEFVFRSLDRNKN